MAKVVPFLTSKANQFITIAKPKLATAWVYSKAELRPPTFGEFPEVAEGLRKVVVSAATAGYRRLTVKEAWLNTLIAAEIAFWFVAGECIGKRGIIGYNIPGAVNWEVHF